MLCIRNNKITKRSNQAKSRGKLGSRVILLQGVTLNQDLIQSKRSYELSDQPSCIGRPKQCEEFENIYLKQSSDQRLQRDQSASIDLFTQELTHLTQVREF